MSDLLSAFIEFVENHSQDFDKSTLFSSNALAGEVGEVANVVKKRCYKLASEAQSNNIAFKDPRLFTKSDYINKLTDELGDVLFYLIQMANRENISMIDIILSQINKIEGQSIEYGHKFVK